MKKKIVLMILGMMVLILLNTSLAIERYYSLELNYFDGIITYRNINLLAGTAPEMGNEGMYTLKLISFYNTVLHESKFVINENKDFTLYVPYYKEAEEIVIFKDRERVFHYDIASFADVCGDKICQLQESYENCEEDCPSGLRDDYCDMIEDNKCDPDCSVELDPDCIEQATPEEVIIKEIKKEPKEEQIKEERIIKEEKIPLYSLLYYIMPLLVIIIIIAVIFSSKYKVKKEHEQQLLDYIRSNLNLGYEPEQIKQVLLNQGYGEKEIDGLFDMLKL